MIRRTAAAFTAWLSAAKVISSDDAELYEYAAYSLMFGMLPVFLAVLWGLFLGMLTEGILMIVPFMLIRKFSGGFHLNSSKVCFVVSSLIIIFGLLSIKTVIRFNCTLPVSVLVGLSMMMICTLSPIDSNARKLTSREVKTFGIFARGFSFLSVGAYFALLIWKKEHIAVPIGVGTIIPAVLQVPCLISTKNTRT